jgi:hypothetical protein
MTVLLGLWSSVVPETALVLTYTSVMSAATVGLLVLCTVALWCERDHHQVRPEPIHFGDKEPLAA